ncbi:hypothetical protein N9475_00475 [Flavobacteriaceae bacterium]|nr:hypothetical protein [Flavobacteriaceae bacterium]
MASFGFLAWAIIFFDIVDKASNIWDARDIGMLKYSWPNYLGLVITNVDYVATQIGSITFYRASGWAEEPAWAAKFVMPSLIFLYFNKNLFNKYTRYIFIAIILSFWFVCAGISSIIAILAVIIFTKLLYYKKRSKWIKLYLIIIPLLLFVFWQLYLYKDIIFLASGFLETKLSSDSGSFNSSFNSLTLILNPGFTSEIFLSLFSLVSVIFASKYAIRSLIKGGDASIYGYIVLYLIIQSAKRGFVYFSFDTFSIFFFYLLIYNLYKQQNTNLRVN